MEILKADHHRTLQLAGVADPVSRPVDIDQRQTGFTHLRSLRIYRFTAGSIIDGHAEDDEVLIVILAGSVQLTLSERDLEEYSPRFHLSAVDNPNGDLCAAYLPPNGAYRLVPQSNAEVAYARATTSKSRAPKAFSAHPPTDHAAYTVLLEQTTYAAHLRLRVAQVKAAHANLTVTPINEAESSSEAFVHVRTESARAMTIAKAGSLPIAVDSWDTVVVLPGEQPTLRVAEGSSALLLVVLASG